MLNHDASSLAQNRAQFLRGFLNVLFTSEFIILVEYTEMVIPMSYGVLLLPFGM